MILAFLKRNFGTRVDENSRGPLIASTIWADHNQRGRKSYEKSSSQKQNKTKILERVRICIRCTKI